MHNNAVVKKEDDPFSVKRGRIPEKQREGDVRVALSVLILMLTALLLLGFSLRSRYGLPLFLMTLGMGAASAAVVYQSYNTSMYSPPGEFPLRSLDLLLYRLIGSWRLPLVHVQVIRVAGCILFFIGILLMLLTIFRNLKQGPRLGAKAILLVLLVTVFSAAYTVLYLP